MVVIAERNVIKIICEIEGKFMPKVEESNIVPQKRDRYPGHHKKVTEGYQRIAVGDAVGLDQFGVNKVTVKPGAATALKHWHENEDEFVIVLSGEVVLVEGDTESTLKAGDCAGFESLLAHHSPASYRLARHERPSSWRFSDWLLSGS